MPQSIAGQRVQAEDFSFAGGQHYPILNDDIDEIKTSSLSMMPDGQWDTLSDDEVRDLVKYLATKEQVPLPDGFREEVAGGEARSE